MSRQIAVRVEAAGAEIGPARTFGCVRLAYNKALAERTRARDASITRLG